MDFIVFVFYSIPEMFLLLALTITFAGYRFYTYKSRFIFAALLLSSFFECLRIFDVSMSLRLILQLLIFLAVSKLLFKIAVVPLVISTVTTLLLIQMFELVALQSAMKLLHTDFQHLQANPILLMLSGWPILLLLSFVLYLSVKHQFSLFGAGRQLSKFKFRSLRSYLTFMLFYTLGIIATSLVVKNEITSTHIFYSVLIFQVLSFLMIKEIIKSRVQETELTVYKESLKDINSLFTTIRAQRHDFANHIQVLYIFAKQQEHDKLLRYIEQLVGEIKSINQVLVSDNPGLSALLQTKTAQFEQDNIALKTEIACTLSELPVPAIELNQMIGNLLDNAADAIKLAGHPTDEIILQTLEKDGQVHIKVRNHRPVIPEHLQQKIFEYGFSTKADHSGIGLAIVNSLVKKHKGNLILTSNEQSGTEFTIIFPAKKVMTIEQKTG
jgi:signal transduction histidine kinase